MDNPSERDLLVAEFWRECSIRRTSILLENQRKLLRDDLQDLVSHIALLVLPMEFPAYEKTQYQDILKEALSRLGDEVFAKLILAILQEEKGPHVPPL